MHHELLFEIGTEEIPAGYIMPALEYMKKNIGRKLKDLSLAHEGIRGVATPRRLTVCVSSLSARQPDCREEILGPPKKAAFDADNQPTKTALGFAKSRGVSLDELQVVTTKKGEYLMVLKEKKGEETEKLLAELLPEIVRELPFPKSMRWGVGRTAFARPIQWFLVVYGDKVIPFHIDGIASADTTKGHRFMAPDSVRVKGFDHYLQVLQKAHVMADPEERRNAVVSEIKRAAGDVGGQIIPDDELVRIVANLVEEPHAVCGAFEKRFLALPREVLITSMREHQKYFAVADANGELLPNFVAVNNTKVKDVGVAAEGHERVLRARLEDALFFFNEDKAKSLADRVDDLSGIIFQSRLGTLLEKTERITNLAGKLASELAPELTEAAKRAAYLSKADLLTSMVNEFPSLQGVMGRDYALLDKEDIEVATAICEHYMPVRAGEPLPGSMSGALVSLADRLDTVTGCFGIGQTPSGATDPYGLRRLTLGLLAIIEERKLRLSLGACLEDAVRLYGDKLTEPPEEIKLHVMEFVKGRFVHDMIARGVPAEAVEAVTSVAFDDVTDCRRRIEALMSISNQPAFTLLAGAFKRVNNIIKDCGEMQLNEGLFSETAERDLFDAYVRVSSEVKPLLEGREYEEALTVILKMKDPVDAFFDAVLVMADDQDLKNNRLALLSCIARLFLKIGDFSKMYAIAPRNQAPE